MNERNRFFLMLAGSLTGLIVLITGFCLPMGRDNAKRMVEYGELKQQVQTIEQFNKEAPDSIEEMLDKAAANLEKSFLRESRLKFVEQITQAPSGANIAFREIVRREPREREGYEVFPADVNIKTSFYDLIRYLIGIETSSLLIGINSLDIAKSQSEPESLDIKANFSGFRLTHQPPPMEKYLQEKYRPLNSRRLKLLLASVKPSGSEIDVLALEGYSPFVTDYEFKKPIEIKKAYPEPEELDSLSLKGILGIGEEKAALINDTIVRKGEMIGGMQVVEIDDFRVVLIHSGKRYILKMGVDDALISP